MASRSHELNRSILVGVGRQRLRTAGDRIRRARELIARETAIASFLLDPVLDAGLPVTEAAELLGMTRQSVYDLRVRGRESGEQLEHRVLAYLTAAGAMPFRGLAERTTADDQTLQEALDQLMQAALVVPAAVHHEGGAAEPWFRATAPGVAAFEEWASRSGARPQLWFVYTPMLPEEREILERVASDVFGTEWYAVVEPGTLTGQKVPELAFHVVATSFDEALEQGRIRVEEIYQAAGITGAWAIRAVLPADAWHAEFGPGG